MCGLIGFTNKQGYTADPNILQKLMSANDKRGGHSTGYFDGTTFRKKLGKSNGMTMPLGSKMFIGHTRYATHGKKVVENQHPFQYGKVIGAHNGVVHNYREVGEKYGLQKTDVDSQMIFNVLDKTKGQIQTLGKFTGALATLFTLGDNKYYTYRKTNPLWVGRDRNNNVYFSSLRDPMQEVGLSNIYQLKESRLYVWQNAKVIAKIDIEQDPVMEKYQTQKKQWWEYGQGFSSPNPYIPRRGRFHGITDLYDTIEDIDITDYELTEHNEQLELFAERCECQQTNEICLCDV